jgi:hypothetical protein
MDAKEKANFINSVNNNNNNVHDYTSEIAITLESLPQSENAFADGLPDWNLEPPHIPIRRKRNI